jgi:hypothetical protein
MVSLSGCASVINASTADVWIHTQPEPAQCDLTGRGGFTRSIQAPALVAVPRAAAPVTVACSAPGFRRTVASLNATPDGWVWGNSALVVVSGGVAILGMAVDEVVGSAWDYRDDLTVPLDVDRRRAVSTRSRGDGAAMTFGER